ncbi:hypothetical protein [Ectobacillus polymachus]|uniref:hypothetical protein n=1 Tax=Ectobacillus polymachus TaxID=1508806 RepID=UPI003A88224F
MSSHIIQVIVPIVLYITVTLFFRAKLKTKWFWSMLIGACASFLLTFIIFKSAGTPTNTDVPQPQQAQSQSTSQQDTTKQAASNQSTAASTAAIGTRFQYNATLKEVEQALGKPVKTIDDYWAGYRLVKFDGESYLFNKQDKVVGMYITSPTISIFGANIGMTQSEIANSLGKAVDTRLEGTTYYTKYKHDGSSISFASKTKNGKIEYAIVVKE